jgi:hypothetical protein
MFIIVCFDRLRLSLPLEGEPEGAFPSRHKKKNTSSGRRHGGKRSFGVRCAERFS